MVTPAPGLPGGGGGDWVRFDPRTGNQQSPGENRTRDWTSTEEKITEVMGNLDKDTVAKACRRFRSWIEAVVAADGNFIK